VPDAGIDVDAEWAAKLSTWKWLILLYPLDGDVRRRDRSAGPVNEYDRAVPRV
jgi:hypothetical protein